MQQSALGHVKNGQKKPQWNVLTGFKLQARFSKANAFVLAEEGSGRRVGRDAAL